MDNLDMLTMSFIMRCDNKISSHAKLLFTSLNASILRLRISPIEKMELLKMA